MTSVRVAPTGKSLALDTGGIKREYGISASTIYGACNRGEFDVVKLGGRSLYLRKDIEAYLARRKLVNP